MDANDELLRRITRRSPLLGSIAKLYAPARPEIVGYEYDDVNGILLLGAARRPRDDSAAWNVDFDPIDGTWVAGSGNDPETLWLQITTDGVATPVGEELYGLRVRLRSAVEALDFIDMLLGAPDGIDPSVPGCDARLVDRIDDVALLLAPYDLAPVVAVPLARLAELAIDHPARRGADERLASNRDHEQEPVPEADATPRSPEEIERFLASRIVMTAEEALAHMAKEPAELRSPQWQALASIADPEPFRDGDLVLCNDGAQLVALMEHGNRPWPALALRFRPRRDRVSPLLLRNILVNGALSESPRTMFSSVRSVLDVSRALAAFNVRLPAMVAAQRVKAVELEATRLAIVDELVEASNTIPVAIEDAVDDLNRLRLRFSDHVRAPRAAERCEPATAPRGTHRPIAPANKENGRGKRLWD